MKDDCNTRSRRGFQEDGSTGRLIGTALEIGNEPFHLSHLGLPVKLQKPFLKCHDVTIALVICIVQLLVSPPLWFPSPPLYVNLQTHDENPPLPSSQSPREPKFHTCIHIKPTQNSPKFLPFPQSTSHSHHKHPIPSITTIHKKNFFFTSAASGQSINIHSL